MTSKATGHASAGSATAAGAMSSKQLDRFGWNASPFVPAQQMADLSMTALNEVLRLSSRQLHAQAEFLNHVCECKTVNELLEEQFRFVRNVAEDCTRTIGNVMETSAAALPNGLAGAKQSDLAND